MDRATTVAQLGQQQFDMLVIGGGASGAGVVLDAASRGLKVALVERNDFSEGTSSRSTKLIHGGVRYLEIAVKKLDRVQLNLVRDALHERATMLKNAPHLSHAVWLLTPLYKAWEVPYYFTGLKMYDALAGKVKLEPSRFVSRKETLERFPTLRPMALKGSVAYQDGQFNDSRYNVEMVLTAVQHGAVVLNYAEVTALHKTNGRLSGATVCDRLAGKEVEVRAKVIVNTTGPFSDGIRTLDDPNTPPLLKASSGIHLVVDKKYSPPNAGMLIPRTEDGRVLFVLPWMGGTLIGTTDDPAPIIDHPPVKEDEITYVLRQVKPYLGSIPREAVLSAWSGLRPLVARKGADTAKLARDHLIQESDAGLLTLTGGKWTTYRKMAMDLVDYAVRKFGLQAGPCRTEQLPLVGGQGFDPQGATKLMQQGVAAPVAKHLHENYGSKARDVLTLASNGYSQQLAAPWPNIEAEVIYAARNEMARSPMDVLSRRTRLAFLDTNAATTALPRVVQLMGKELGWNDGETQRQEQQAREQLTTAI
ncbi:MAG: FAD-dependent oxidoreductase [Chloroflexaceae bacterium]|jgi:glycerol-3-phosphate dehydrogenase|nr:FAD-dependent oxidoreductase [Chloroflexaceae bacterium]